MPAFAQALTTSGDKFNKRGRRPWASVNFVTAHDGFTLADLVSYNDKHNDANGEDYRDGSSDNRSWNCGAEGPTDDAEVLALRARQQRSMLATLLLSQGTPMMVAGDELGRSSRATPDRRMERGLACQGRDLADARRHRDGRGAVERRDHALLRPAAGRPCPDLRHRPPRCRRDAADLGPFGNGKVDSVGGDSQRRESK